MSVEVGEYFRTFIQRFYALNLKLKTYETVPDIHVDFNNYLRFYALNLKLKTYETVPDIHVDFNNYLWASS